MAQPLPQLFGVIPTGTPCLTTPTSSPSPSSFIYNLPPKPFSHICIFLLPGITLPLNTAAAVYLKLPSSTDFKFLGGVGPGKESAVFKISGLSPAQSGEVDMDAEPTLEGGGEITLGISLESAEQVAAQIASLHPPPPPSSAAGNSGALVVAGRGSGGGKVDTTVLAQRIIKNAFNFLASFSGNLDGGVEVVPLKAFEEWWRKFEGRVRSDPGFLERDGD